MKRGEQDFTHKYIHREVYKKIEGRRKALWVDRGALGFTKWRGVSAPFLTFDRPKKRDSDFAKKREPVNSGSGHVLLIMEGKKPKLITQPKDWFPTNLFSQTSVFLISAP